MAETETVLGSSPEQENEDESLKRKRESEQEASSKRPRTEGAYPKKKKEYVPKSTFVADDEFEDILVSGWFYIDTNQQQQGPFTTRDMKEWYVAGFFTDDMLVSRVNMSEWKLVVECEEFKHLEKKPIREHAYVLTSEEPVAMAYYPGFSGQNPYYSFGTAPSVEQTQPEKKKKKKDRDPEKEKRRELAIQTAFLNLQSGRVQSNSLDYWTAKGLPTDRDGRMLAHYLDIDSYQDQMRLAKQNPVAKHKTTKKMVKAFKKKKEDKKRRRALML